MTQAVEDAYQWKSSRGLQIVKTAILAIEYDEDTKALLSDVKKADALSGARGNAFMQQAAARGMQSAGENGGAAGMAFMGMGMNAAGAMVNGMQQQPTQSSYQPNFAQPQMMQQPAQQPMQQYPQQPAQAPVQQPVAEDPYAKLASLKNLLDQGVITQADFDAAKNKILGI